jgi:hypothetical protein
MFGTSFLSGLAEQARNSTGKSASTGALSGVKEANDKLGQASAARAQTNNVAGSNATAGFTGSGGGGQAGENNLDLTRITSDPEQKTLKEVGTTVNKDNPQGGPATPFKGYPSLINPYVLVRYHSIMDGAENANSITDLNVTEGDIDYRGLADYEQYKNPSTSIIIDHYNQGPGTTQPERSYSYSDFLYLKHYHPFNNNRLITLRRFMAPVYDELRVALKSELFDSPLRKPIAQALSYLDVSNNKLSNFTKMNVKINSKAIQSLAGDNPIEIKEAENFLQSVTGDASGGVAQTGIKLLSILSGTGSNIGNLENWTSAYDPWKQGPLSDLVYGPVNVVTGAKIRERGLTFTQSNFKVCFEYSSKTIENVNQKAAMLDILANTLALTYNHALFWGGENRFLIDRANFPLARTELVFSLLSNLNNPSLLKTALQKEVGLGAKTVADSVGDFYKDLVKDGFGAFTDEKNKNKLAGMATQYLLADATKIKELQRTVLEKTKAELTGAPTGEWHLQVGNPFAPIMMIGNLWCTTTEIEFNDELSIDDFPTEFKFTCTLEHGRPRDASDIQSIFNAGGGRIYYPYKDGVIDINKSSSTYNTESQVKLKSTDTKNAFGSSTKDNSGRTISDLVKVDSKAVSKIQTQYMQPISSIFK